MIIEGADIEIPDSLIIDGDWDLAMSGVAELPGGLSVSGNLDLWNTKLTSLPEGLRVDGYLDIGSTNITELPAGLSVDGPLFADTGQLITSEEVQLEWVVKNKDMLRFFKEPTEKANRLHEMLWEM